MRLAERTLSISPSPTLALDSKAKEMAKRGESIVNFAAGEPDFDTPAHVRGEAIKAIERGFTKYTPVAGIPELKQAICDKLAVDNGLKYEPEEIVVSAGAKHSIYNALMVLCGPGDEVIVPAPYWVSYPEQIRLCGAKPVMVHTSEENGYKLTAKKLESYIGDKSRVLILNSPSNPTGSVYTEAELRELVDVVKRHGIWLISDEVYEKLVYDGVRHVSPASFDKEIRGLCVVVNGVSKAYSMTGWRIGYAAAPKEVAKAMSDLQSHSTSNPTSISQWASLAALRGPQEPVAQMVAEFQKRRDYMWQALASLPGVKCRRSEGAFYLFPNVKGLLDRVATKWPARSVDDLAEILLEECKVAVVPGTGFGADEHIRLSYATSMDGIVEGMERIKKFVAGV